jgi:hypothetical protein
VIINASEVCRFWIHTMHSISGSCDIVLIERTKRGVGWHIGNAGE